MALKCELYCVVVSSAGNIDCRMFISDAMVLVMRRR